MWWRCSQCRFRAKQYLFLISKIYLPYDYPHRVDGFIGADTPRPHVEQVDDLLPWSPRGSSGDNHRNLNRDRITLLFLHLVMTQLRDFYITDNLGLLFLCSSYFILSSLSLDVSELHTITKHTKLPNLLGCTDLSNFFKNRCTRWGTTRPEHLL